MIDRDPTDLGMPRPLAPGSAAHSCRAGWLGNDDAPRPCPVCRPHLAHRADGWHLNPAALPPQRRKAIA